MSEQHPDRGPVGARTRLARALPDAAAAAARRTRAPAPPADPALPSAGAAPPADHVPPLVPPEPHPRTASDTIPPPEAARTVPPEPVPHEPVGRDGVVARLGGAAFDPGRPGVRVLAVVAAVVVLGAAVFVWWSRPRPEPVVPQVTATAPMPTPSGAATPAELVVAVTGKVHQPGLVRLPPGARVADAVEAAGGVLPDAELDYLNLARKVADGELIAVGIPAPPAPQAAPGGGAGGKVNLNTADQQQLETLPGVGPTLAQRILNHRGQQGPFEAVAELRQVSGIGEVRFAELRDLVTV